MFLDKKKSVLQYKIVTYVSYDWNVSWASVEVKFLFEFFWSSFLSSSKPEPFRFLIRLFLNVSVRNLRVRSMLLRSISLVGIIRLGSLCMQERKTRVKLAGRSSLYGKEGSGREGEMGWGVWGGGGVLGQKEKKGRVEGRGWGVGCAGRVFGSLPRTLIKRQPHHYQAFQHDC